jgi:hypothetical protein
MAAMTLAAVLGRAVEGAVDRGADFADQFLLRCIVSGR